MIHSLQTWVPGHTVGQYVLARELARGGMGEIWLARQSGTPEFERLVVLKRVISSGGDDSSAMTMFLDEARIASKLSHPNIVQVFELGRDGGSVFLVMEYLTGQTLSRFARRMVEKDGRVPASLAVAIVASAAKGLGYAHRRVDLEGKPLNIVHRDVSPQNLFVTYDGEVKVLDFGIARAAGRMGRTMTGVIKGKVAYMSPEQAAGGGVVVTGAADVYAMGIILFELITGTRLYKNLDDLGVLRRLAISAKAPTPSSRGGPVDPDLERLIMRALEPEPDERFADGQAFFEALEAWLSAHPRGAGEPTLQAMMHALFAADVDALGEFHRQAAATPALVSNPSMPNKTAATLPRASSPLPLRGPVGPSSMITETSPITAAPVAAPSRSLAGPLGLAAVAILIVGGGIALWARPAPVAPTPAPSSPAPTAAPTPRAEVPAAVVAEVPAVDAGIAAELTPPPRPSRPPPATPRVSPGALSLNTEPWTRVFLGRKALGDTPLISVPLPGGNHRLRLVNEAEHIDTVIDVTIKANETTVKKFVF